MLTATPPQIVVRVVAERTELAPVSIVAAEPDSRPAAEIPRQLDALFLPQLRSQPQQLSRPLLLSPPYRRCPSREPAAQQEQRSPQVLVFLPEPPRRRDGDDEQASRRQQLQQLEAELQLPALLLLDDGATEPRRVLLHARASHAPTWPEFAQPDHLSGG